MEMNMQKYLWSFGFFLHASLKWDLNDINVNEWENVKSEQNFYSNSWHSSMVDHFIHALNDRPCKKKVSEKKAAWVLFMEIPKRCQEWQTNRKCGERDKTNNQMWGQHLIFNFVLRNYFSQQKKNERKRKKTTFFRRFRLIKSARTLENKSGRERKFAMQMVTWWPFFGSTSNGMDNILTDVAMLQIIILLKLFKSFDLFFCILHLSIINEQRAYYNNT